jgi:hypothetical protein
MSITCLAGVHMLFLLVINVYSVSKNCLKRVHSLFMNVYGSYSSRGVTCSETESSVIFVTISLAFLQVMP